jgi:peptide/nickel transport system permease protein
LRNGLFSTFHGSESLKELWSKYRRNKAAVCGVVILVFFFFVAALAPLIATARPLEIGFALLSPPNLEHYFGTDDLGRDLFSEWVYGARVTMTIGLLAGVASTLVGVAVGSISGFYGGRLDDIFMRVTELFLVIPRFFLALLAAALFGASVWNVIIIIVVLSWPTTARLVRAEFLSLKEKEFVTAVRALGGKNRTLIAEILPNASPSFIVNGSLEVARAILLEAGMSFLGVGDANLPSWGYMLYSAQRFLRLAWWPAFFPGLGIFLVSLGSILVGEGLNDALNPRLKER